MSRQYLGSKPGPRLPIFNVRMDEYLLHDQHRFTSVVLESADSVTVTAVTRSREIILVRQYRFGIRDYSLEIPGGFVDEHEDLQVAAARELREESGYTATRWIYLGWVYANPVFMTARLHNFLALDASQTETMRLDPAEDVTVELMPFDQFLPQSSSLVRHPHTLSALYLLHQHLAVHPLLWPKA